MVEQGSTKSNNGWRWLFFASATYNAVIGLAGLANVAAPMSDRIVGLLVVCFGIIYAMVGRDPKRFGPTLWAGVVGRIGVIALFLPSVLARSAQPGLSIVLSGDGMFVLGFLAFLLRR